MKRLLISITILALLVFPQVALGADDVEADIQGIKDIIEEWSTATTAGDLDDVMTHYADNVVMIQPNIPAFHGKDAVRKDFQQWFNSFNLQEEDVIKDIHVSGDLAVAHVIWETKQTPKSGGETKKIYGNWIIVFKRQPDSKWNCIYTIYSDESLTPPAKTE